MLQKIIKKAKDIGFADVEIVVRATDEVTINLFKGNIDKNFNGSNKSYTLKGIIDDKMAQITFQKNNQDFTDEEIDELLKKLKENVIVLTTNEKASIFAGSEKYPTLKKEPTDIDEVTIDQKIATLKEIEKAAYAADERIKLAHYCQYIEEKTSLEMVNSKGLNLSKSNQYCGYVLGVVAGDSLEDPKKQTGFRVELGKRFDKVDTKALVQKATSSALDLIGAEPVESKNYPVIIENETMISLLGGFFSMFTGEYAIKNLTGLKGKIGEKIMSDLITIVDDPLSEEAIFQNTFDAEGVATYTKDVVKNGVFKTFLHNLKTAESMQTVSTGNAASSGVCPMNFHIAAGNTSKEEMIANIEEGLLINSIAGLHASLNDISGDFSGQASGFLIKNGKKDRPVSLIVISGNFLKMMNDVESVGNDLVINSSSIGSPSILFKSLPISGK